MGFCCCQSCCWLAPCWCHGDPRAHKRLRRFLDAHYIAELLAVTASLWASWLLETPDGVRSPGVFSLTLVLVGGLEHSVCSLILILVLTATLYCRRYTLGTYAILCAVGACQSVVQLLGILLLLDERPGGARSWLELGIETELNETALLNGTGSWASAQLLQEEEAMAAGPWRAVACFVLIGAALLPFRAVGLVWAGCTSCREPEDGEGHDSGRNDRDFGGDFVVDFDGAGSGGGSSDGRRGQPSRPRSRSKGGGGRGAASPRNSGRGFAALPAEEEDPGAGSDSDVELFIS